MSTITSYPHPFAILVVDDDPDLCMALTDFLEVQGHRVDAVGTGAEAVERVTIHHFDAVLLDIGLPDIDGLTVLRTLIKLKPHLPVIILTAYNFLGRFPGKLDAPEAYAALGKPYKVSDLTAILSSALGSTIFSFDSQPTQQGGSRKETQCRLVVDSPNTSLNRANQRRPIFLWSRDASA